MLTKEQIEVELLIEVMRKKQYRVFDNMQPYNLNIGGIRSEDMTPNIFNDFLFCFYRDEEKKMKIHVWPGTTDPGLYWLNNPSNVNGTAILVPNQYLGVFALDLHANKYLALCQRLGKVCVYRDNNKDNRYDIDYATAEWGFFGINLHRASKWKHLKFVGRYSAGCQVHQLAGNFDHLIRLSKHSASLYRNAFSYTLLEEKDLYGENLLIAA